MDNRFQFGAGSNLTLRALRLQLLLWKKIELKSLGVNFRFSIKLVHLFKMKKKQGEGFENPS